MNETKAEPKAPPRIPDHELVRRIGRGAYGEVWLARSVIGAYRAIKIVHRHSFDHDRPFEREFSGILKFEPISRQHDSQVDILHVGRGEDCFYYVMELADDQFTGQLINPDTYAPKTLKTEIFQRGKLPSEECVQISLALTTALDHLHSHGLVHRDVKPSNIIFVNGVPKLADIGLVTNVDATRSYVGTEGFAPPEGPGTPQADIYSLGKVLYEMCTGKDRQEFPELPTDLDVAADREVLLELNAVIGKACRHESRQRYPSAKAMRDELLLLQSGKSLARLRMLERALGRIKQLSVAGAVLVTIVASALVWQIHQARRMKTLATAVRESLYAADIWSAQHALEGDNLRQALDLLQRQIPKPGESDLRGFEWRYLWQQSQSEALFNLPGHRDTLTSLAFSPDGRLILSGSRDHTAKVWDVATRRLVATLTGHKDLIWSVAFSPGNDFMATASDDVRIWDVASFRLVHSFPRRTTQVCFSPDGRYLAAAYTNVVLWNTTTWQVVKSIELPPPWESLEDREYWPGGKELRLAFSPFDQQLAVVARDGVTLFTVPQLQGHSLLKERMPRLRFAAFSADGKTLAIPSGGRNVKFLDVRTGIEIRVLSGHLDGVNEAAFSADGKWLATAGMDQTVKLWDVNTGGLARSYRGHAEEVWGVAFSPDGKVLASGSKDGALECWDPTARPGQASELGDFQPVGFDSAGHPVGFAPDLTSYDPQTREKEPRLGFPDRTTNSQAWRQPSVELGNLCDNGRMMGLYSLKDSEAKIWDLARRRLICSLPAESRHMAFSSEGSMVATATSNETVTVWQLPGGSRCCLPINAREPIAFTADGRTLLTFILERGHSFLNLWRIDRSGGQASIRPLRGLKGFNAAFSPDGRTVAYACWGALVRLCDVATGRELTTFVGHTRDVSGIGFCPDGKTLATSADDGTVRLWHVTTGRELMRFHFPTMDPKVQRLAFSTEARTFA